MTEAAFSAIALKICVTGLVLYMVWIIYNIGKESNAGRFGMMILFIGLGVGLLGFVLKGIIQFFLIR